MRLTHLHLTAFRNLTDQVLEFPPEGVAIIGRNAQGKSNLLEAIHYLETLRSFRGAREDQLVRFGCDVFRVTGRCVWDAPEGDSAAGSDPPAPVPGAEPLRTRSVTVAYRASTKEKRVTVDGEPAARIAEAIGRFGGVLFTPDDIRLVSDGPLERRRFLDIVLSLDDRAYLIALQRFRQALSQRNAALRRGDGGPAVEAWDALVCDAGSRVCLDRATWIRDHDAAFSRYSAAISGEGAASMRYEPSIAGADQAGELTEVRDAYLSALQKASDVDRRARTTTVGPHRDEVRFLLNSGDGERDAREFGSGGQKRTIALALRLAEADTVRSRGVGEPVLLLDDVFAELDENRSSRLLRLLDERLPGQVILTAPKESDVRFRGDILPRWTIRSGAVTS